MSTDAKKHTTFAAGEVPKRQVAGGAGLADALLSINDAVPVASATEQTQIGAALSMSPYPVGPSRPLTTVRADARALHQLEVSRDGSVFVPQSGQLAFATESARDTWTSSNSSLLAAGDRCVIGAAEYVWSGTAWGKRGWADYAPTITGCTATVDYCQYHVAFEKATVRVSLSISVMTANPTISLPVSAKVATLEHLMGAVALVPSAGSEAPGYIRKQNATTVMFYAALVSGSNLYINNIGPTTPITFAGGKIIATFEYAV